MAQSFFKITLDNGITPLVLSHNPAGIEDFKIKYKRHAVYGSVFRSIGSTLRFVKEGRDYLRTLFMDSGLDAHCSIIFEELNLENKTYSSIYEGVIDFSTYKESLVYTECGVLDNDVVSKFLARENTSVNLLSEKNIDGNLITNPLPPQTLVSLTPINPVYWATANDSNILKNIAGIDVNYSATINPSGVTTEDYLGGDFNEVDLKYTNNGTASKTMVFSYTANTHILGSINVTDAGSPPGSVTFDFKIVRLGDNTTVQSYNVVTNPVIGRTSLSFSQVFNGKKTTPIPVNGSEGLIAIVSISFDAGVVATVDFDLNVDFSLYDIYYKDPIHVSNTDCFTFRPIDAATRILEQMGIDTITTPVISTAISTGDTYELIQLTNGKKIRQAKESTPLNLSFRSFFDIYSKALGLIMWFDGTEVRIDNFDYFYNGASGGIGLTKYSNFSTSIAEDKYFTKILAGYKTVNYQGMKGNIEYNTDFEYSTRNTNTKNAKDLRIKARADSIGIETLRRSNYKAHGQDTVNGDEDLFLISAVPSTSAGLYRAEIGSDFTSVAGIRDSDQYYNFRITPWANLSRNSFYIQTSQALIPNSNIVEYIGSKNNIPLVVNGTDQLNGTYLTGSYKTPMYYEFDTPLNDTIWNFLNTMINTIVGIDGKGYGFVEEVDVNLYKNSVHWKLIRD